jgi:hypothetical protein
MHTQTLQRLRTEVEAASTLHLALGRIATRANPAAPTAWTGPLLEELEDLTDDDGGFDQAGVAEIRRRSVAALIAQLHSVKAAVEGAPKFARTGFSELLVAALATGTGNASLTLDTAGSIVSGLVKSGELRLDFAIRAASLARDGLPQEQPAPQPKKPAKKAPAAKKKPAAAPKKKAPAARKKPAAPKKKAPPAKKKTPAKKPAAKKKPGKR